MAPRLQRHCGRGILPGPERQYGRRTSAQRRQKDAGYQPFIEATSLATRAPEELVSLKHFGSGDALGGPWLRAFRGPPLTLRAHGGAYWRWRG
jgi:hypothetical protein